MYEQMHQQRVQGGRPEQGEPAIGDCGKQFFREEDHVPNCLAPHTPCIKTSHALIARQAEAVCADRCVAKFLQVHQFIGKKFNDMQQAAMAAEQQQPK
jgi:hypothetical protein